MRNRMFLLFVLLGVIFEITTYTAKNYNLSTVGDSVLMSGDTLIVDVDDCTDKSSFYGSVDISETDDVYNVEDSKTVIVKATLFNYGGYVNKSGNLYRFLQNEKYNFEITGNKSYTIAKYVDSDGNSKDALYKVINKCNQNVETQVTNGKLYYTDYSSEYYFYDIPSEVYNIDDVKNHYTDYKPIKVPTTYYLDSSFYSEDLVPVTVKPLLIQYIGLKSEPQINISCDLVSIPSDKSSNCKISIESEYKLNNLEFNLDFSSLDVSNVNRIANGLTITELGDNKSKIVFINGDNLETDNLELITFKINNKNISLEDDIKVSNTTYTNTFYSGDVEDDSLTITLLKEGEKPKEEKVTNPKTGIRNYFFISSLIIMSIAYVYFRIRGIKNFKKL